MKESVYLDAQEAAYDLAAAAHFVAERARNFDREGFKRALSEFEQRFPAYEESIQRALPGIPPVFESLSIFGNSGPHDSVHRAVLEHGRFLMWWIGTCRQTEMKIVSTDTPPNEPPKVTVDEDLLSEFLRDQQQLKLTGLPQLYHQLKREHHEAHIAIKKGVEHPADGPVAPDRFRCGETLHGGFSPSQFSFMRALWARRDRSASFEELASSPYDDHTKELTARAARALANKINRRLGDQALYRIKVTQLGGGSAVFERIDGNC